MRSMQPKPTRELEEAVVDAWPSADSEEADGWLLRARGGPGLLGNSIAPLDATGDASLESRLAQAEAWYASRNAPVCFQLGPSARPIGLEEALKLRGYEPSTTTLALTASPTDIAALRIKDKNLETSLAFKASAVALELTALSGPALSPASETPPLDNTAYDELRGVWSRLGTRCRFVVVRDGRGIPIASCVGIASEARLGIYAMFTRPEARRKGAAHAMLQALAQSAVTDQVTELYALVDEASSEANALYLACGFREAYRFHYLVCAAKSPVA